MFHFVFFIASRLLCFGNMLQRFSHGIRALRSLDRISSRLIPALPPPPPIPLLDPPTALADFPDEFILPNASADLFAIESQSRIFSSLIPRFPSALIAVTPSQLPNPVFFFFMLAVISGSLVLLSEIYVMNAVNLSPVFAHSSSKSSKPLKANAESHSFPAGLPSHRFSLMSLGSMLLFWTGPLTVASLVPIIWIIFILISRGEAPNIIVTKTIPRWCGISAEQDSQTPPVVLATYEQITRRTVGHNAVRSSHPIDQCNEGQAITNSSFGYSHLEARFREQERDSESQDIPMRREKQDRLALAEKLEEKYRHREQHIRSEFLHSQNDLRQQLYISRAREQNLRANLLAAENESDELISLVSTLEESNKKRQEWEEIAVIAKCRHAEAKRTVSKLRADLTTAMEQARAVQEQLDSQKVLVLANDCTIQSVTEESQQAHRKLKVAENEIAYLGTELRQERDRRLRETKELLDERARIQDRYEAEMHLIARDAWDAQDQLIALRDELSRLRTGGQSPLHCAHPYNYRHPTTAPVDRDTGQPPLPPEPCFDTGTPLLSYATDAKPNERGDRHLEKELEMTMEKLKLAEQKALKLRRNLEQSKEAMWDMENHAMDLEYELHECQANLREALDARRECRIKFVEAVELLRQRRTELELSTDETKASQFKCSQVTLLSAALQERVTELEAEVKALKSAQKSSARIAPRTESCSVFPTDRDTAISHNADLQSFDSVYITAPSSLPCLLDLPLPPSTSQSSDNSLYLDQHGSSAIIAACINSHALFPADTDLDAMTHNTNPQSLNSTQLTLPLPISHHLCSGLPASSPQSNDISLDLSHLEITPPSAVGPTKTNHESTNLFSTRPPPLLPLHSVSYSLPLFDSTRVFLSERNSVGSVDWPPIESALLPEGRNDGQDNDIDVQENAGNTIVVSRKVPSSTAKKLNVIPLDNALSVSLMMSVDSPDSSQVAVLEKGPLISGEPHNFQHDARPDNSRDPQPLSIPAYPPLSSLHSHERRVETCLTIGIVEQEIRSSPQDSNEMIKLSTSIALLASISESLLRHTTSLTPRYNYEHTPSEHVPPDLPHIGLPTCVQNGDSRSTDDAIQTSISDPRIVGRPLETHFSALNPEWSRRIHHEMMPKPQSGGYDLDLQNRNVLMQSCREVPTPQSAKVVAVESDLAPTALIPGRDCSFAARTCQRDTPILDNQEALLVSVPNEPSGREDVEAQAVRCTIPELLDPLVIGSGQASLLDNDSPCASERPGKCGRPNHYRVHSRPRDIQKLDYGLPKDFAPGSGSWRVGPEAKEPSPDLDEFAFIIPPGCRTSTPRRLGNGA